MLKMKRLLEEAQKYKESSSKELLKMTETMLSDKEQREISEETCK